MTLKTLPVTTLPDFKSKHFSDPCMLPESPSDIHPWFNRVWPLVTIEYVLASTNDPKYALHFCFVVNLFLGDYLPQGIFHG